MNKGTEAPEIILHTEGLSKAFGGFDAVKDLSLTVRRGEIHALIGPNGAGKTTCFNLVTKVLKPTSGVVFLCGRDITALSPAAIARLGLVRSFQISAVFADMTALENVRIGLQQRHHGMSLDFWRSDRILNRLNDEAMDLLERVGLAHHAHHGTATLSYGRKRALEIATTLALEPEVMLLDEPMSGMGHEDIDRTAALIETIRKGRTILMVEHNLSVVEQLSDRISVMSQGQMLAEGTYEEVSQNPAVVEAYLGADA